MNRGYSGFYNGIFLRSSYEYAFAKYLDYYQIPWKYEEKQFQLKTQNYKPDFFIYSNGKLLKIVEVKSKDRRYISKATILLEELSETFNIETELITYKDLLSLYQSMPCTLNSAITDWNESPKTTISKKIDGKNNPHFNHFHSPITKKIFGEHTKKLWASDSVAKKRMIEGLRKSGLSQKGKIKVPREPRICANCNSEFVVLISSPQRYCSKKCSCAHNIVLATERYVSNRKEIMKSIHEFIIEWTKANKEIVKRTPYNKVSTTLNQMLDEIYKRYNVKDIRVISKAVFGTDKGRKELLKYMKSLLK